MKKSGTENAGTGSTGTGSTGILPVYSADRLEAYPPSEETCHFMRPFEDIDIHVRKLPHWNQANALVFVTWRLADSLPQAKLAEIEEVQKAFLSACPEPWDEATVRLYRKNVSREKEAFLDAGHGACVMKEGTVRQLAEDALRFFDGSRYRLHAYVVMPNHVHVLFEVLPGYPQNRVLHMWKSYTAKAINKALGRQGRLWQDESWDRLIRNESHYRNCVAYIRDNNPRLACILTPCAAAKNTGSTGILPVHSDDRLEACPPSEETPVHAPDRLEACPPSGRMSETGAIRQERGEHA